MRKTCVKILCFFLFLQSGLWALTNSGTITLFNDSPFILTATVYTHDGDFLGQITLQPGQQKNFVSNMSSTNLNRPSNSSTSITPYRVVWQCAGGEFYSMCTDASVGAFIRATGCPGKLFCSPKKDQQKPEQTGPIQSSSSENQ